MEFFPHGSLDGRFTEYKVCVPPLARRLVQSKEACLKIDWLPSYFCMAQEGAGGERDIDLRDLVLDQRVNFTQLRFGKPGGGVKNIGAGANA